MLLPPRLAPSATRSSAILMVVLAGAAWGGPAYTAHYSCGWFDSVSAAVACSRARWDAAYPGHGDCIWTPTVTTYADSTAQTIVQHAYTMTNNCGGGMTVYEYLCKSGYYWNATTHVCVRQCQSSTNCDDQDPCNGAETCGADGGCQAGTPVNCDDGTSCTVDSCRADAGCLHAPLCPDAGTACSPTTCDESAGRCVTTFNDAGCTCDPPPVTTAASSFDGKVSLGSRACPSVVGGSFGASLTYSGSVRGQLATCANNCSSSLSASGTAGASFGLCSATLSASGTASLEKSSVSDTTCGAATCSTGCGGASCDTLKASTSLDLKFSRFYGYQRTEKVPGFDMKTRCGGTLSAGASLSGKVDSVSASSQGAPTAGCATCVKNSLSLTGSAGAAVDCSVDFGTARLRRVIGCKKCLSLDTKLTGAVGSHPAGCASGSCQSARADATLGVSLPGLDASYRWWKVRAACAGSVSACSELNSCGTCSCGGAACTDTSSKFSCTVCASGPLTSGLTQCQ